jgi:glycosyltransferase involved in cell wall biosynthesis
MTTSDSAAEGIRVSVCMAAYNGEAFIREQLDTILPQLHRSDEVVVVDDGSTDRTADVVRGLNDERVRLIRLGRNVGYVKAFEHALLASRGEYVFLSDQDDRWLPGRVEDMVTALQAADVVASNFGFFGHAPRAIESRRLRTSNDERRWTNLLFLWVGVMPYYGCAMAFRRKIAPVILPFPVFLTETHDQWIAMVGLVSGSIGHLEQDTLVRRLHDSNTTPKERRSLATIVRSRIMLARAFGVAVRRAQRRDRGRTRRS